MQHLYLIKVYIILQNTIICFMQYTTMVYFYLTIQFCFLYQVLQYPNRVEVSLLGFSIPNSQLLTLNQSLIFLARVQFFPIRVQLSSLGFSFHSQGLVLFNQGLILPPRVQFLGFRVQVLGFRIQCLGCMIFSVQGLLFCG